jgi:hypothetical protein
MGRACSTCGAKKNAYRILVRKPEGKRPRHRWLDTIKIELTEIEERYNGVVWTGLIWFRIEISKGLL